ncbi:MAG: O-antigen translocase [Betaproteobacteria bacterium]|nr:O-antigen translocase [Betaproteobacteria bacterium]
MTSHRQIFRSNAIIGGASVATVVIGIVKVKVLAMLLGPAGVGLMGFYQNIVGLASRLAGCGLDSSGVRQLAVSTGKDETLTIVRRALWLGNLTLGLLGMVFLWLLREPVAKWVFGDITHVASIGWLGAGVLLTLIASSQTALLQGLRRIGDLARVNIVSAFLGAAVGILLVYWIGEAGVVWFVLVAPAATSLVAALYAARLPRAKVPGDWSAIRQQGRAMLKLGIPVMLAGVFTLLVQLAVRTLILRELGSDASGYFQAAWFVSLSYIGFVLGGISTDYFPRLTAIIDDHVQVRNLVNAQTEMALLLAGPIILGMIAFAPWAIHLLYAENFVPAADVLRWQMLGDIFKVTTWPVAFIFLAQGRGGLYIAVEFTWNTIYFLVMIFGVQKLGLAMAGVSYWIAYLVLYGIVLLVSSRIICYKPTQRNVVIMLALWFSGLIIIFIAEKSPSIGYVTGFAITLIFCIYSLRRLEKLLNLQNWLRRKFQNISSVKK